MKEAKRGQLESAELWTTLRRQSPKIGEEKEGVEGGNKIKEIRRRGKCKQEEPTVAELHSTPRCGIIVWGKTAAK